MSFCVITKKKTTALIVEFSWMDHRSKVRFNNLLFLEIMTDRPTTNQHERPQGSCTSNYTLLFKELFRDNTSLPSQDIST